MASPVDVTQSWCSQQARLRQQLCWGRLSPQLMWFLTELWLVTAKLLKLSNFSHLSSNSGGLPGSSSGGAPLLLCSPALEFSLRSFKSLTTPKPPSGTQVQKETQVAPSACGAAHILSLLRQPFLPCYSMWAQGILEDHFLPACQTGSRAQVPSSHLFFPHLSAGPQYPFPPS